LIESLEQRLDTSVVWECLQARGLTKETLLQKWKRRALVFLGKGYDGLLEFKLARNCFKSALVLIQSDPSLVKDSNEIRQLIVVTSKKLEKQSKNEKEIWTKAFKKQESEVDITTAPPPSPARETSTKSSKVAPKDSAKAKDEDDIDLSEFGIGNKAKGTNSNQVAVKTSTQYFFFSLFSLGLIGAFAYFGKLRNFKWRF
jgi:hypothetical protein